MINIIETNLKFKAMDLLEKVNRIILHHRAGNGTAESIHTIHLNRGYSGAGYHYYVRKDGSIHKLRDEKYVGAHAYGSNFDSIGICFEGNFEIEEMTQEQINAGKELVAYLKNKYGISKVQKHLDVCNTSCPGKNFKFDEIVNGTTENVQVTEKPAHENENTDVFKDGKINCIFDIQEYLNKRYGCNLALDNIFGVKTKSALVKALQIELNRQYSRNLVEDGIFGTKTYNACVTVKRGAEGNITKLIQMALFVKNYKIDMDSIFGANTENIVKQFQSDTKLSVDGIVGKNTFKALFA